MIRHNQNAVTSLRYQVINSVFQENDFTISSFFSASFVLRCSQWQQCIGSRHSVTVSWIAIVLRHKTNGSAGISVDMIKVIETLFQFVSIITHKLFFVPAYVGFAFVY